jgi:hypothetical protein
MYLNDLKGGDEIGKYKDVKKQDDFKGWYTRITC